MRLFVAVRPPAAVVSALEGLERPAVSGVRWTTTEQWHVTLRFFGEVEDATPIVHALSAVPLPIARAVIGPRAGMLGRGVVQLPVSGLSELASVVDDATATFGQTPPTRPFRGHLTLARTKARVDATELLLRHEWDLREIELIRSHLGREGARYETLERFGLGGL